MQFERSLRVGKAAGPSDPEADESLAVVGPYPWRISRDRSCVLLSLQQARDDNRLEHELAFREAFQADEGLQPVRYDLTPRCPPGGLTGAAGQRDEPLDILLIDLVCRQQ